MCSLDNGLTVGPSVQRNCSTALSRFSRDGEGLYPADVALWSFSREVRCQAIARSPQTAALRRVDTAWDGCLGNAVFDGAVPEPKNRLGGNQPDYGTCCDGATFAPAATAQARLHHC